MGALELIPHIHHRTTVHHFQNETTLSRVVGFPGDTVVKNPPANAGDTGLIPGMGSLCSRARELQLLSPRATTTEAREPRARAPREKPPQ